MSLSLPLSVQCPAKVNLALWVVGKRPDGYHELASLVVPVSLFDHLTVQPSKQFALRLKGPFAADLSRDPSPNLLRVAWEKYAAIWKVPPVALTLDKQIPVGGGLGGGSSDAAVWLRIMARLAARPPSPKALFQAAAALGADVPFFLSPNPAILTGKGEKVTPIDVPWALRLTLVYPGRGVSTPKAYESLKAKPATPAGVESAAALARNLEREMGKGILPGEKLFNTFQKVVPRPKELGSEWHLSGSGACWFRRGWQRPEIPWGWKTWCVSALMKDTFAPFA